MRRFFLIPLFLAASLCFCEKAIASCYDDGCEEEIDPCQEEPLEEKCTTTCVGVGPNECCSCVCDLGPASGYLSVRHRGPGGIGYPLAYSSVDLFFNQNLGYNWYGILDLRGHVANDGKWATNAGIGLRYLNDCATTVYGLNFYWDWREADHFNFHQLGAGIEFLWPCWDLRLNGYAPITSTKKTYRKKFDRFQGNRSYFEKKQELALSGLDGAVGYWLYNCGIFGIHTALGGYYFRGDHGTNVGGGLLRAKVRITDIVSLKGEVSYDNEFKWNGQGELAIHIPFGPEIKRYSRSVSDCCSLLAIEYRLAEQVERFEIPPTARHCETDVLFIPLD